MTLSVDTLRDRIDDVIDVMERQFAGITPEIEALVTESLRGNKAAYKQLQLVGRQILAPMIDQYGLAVGSLAAEWYDLNRELYRIAGPWGGATLQDPNRDTGPLVGGALTDFVSVQTVIDGLQSGMDLRVRQASNGTIMDSVMRDRQALGWGRAASAGCCGFCALLASRGAVYRTVHTATFCPHEHCHCQAVPMWESSLIGQSLRSRADTIATRRALTDKQRAAQNSQASAWIAENRTRLGLLTQLPA